MNTIRFACGATYTADKVELNRNGKPQRMLTMANCSNGPQRPSLGDGKFANCLLLCPARARDSKRKVSRAWVGKVAVEPTGEPVLCVTCVPVEVV